MERKLLQYNDLQTIKSGFFAMEPAGDA